MSQSTAGMPLLGQPEALCALGAEPPGAPSVVSTLSAADSVLLSSVGWEPVGIGFGAAMVSVPRGPDLRTGEPVRVTEAVGEAFTSAVSSCEDHCRSLGAEGAIGVAARITIGVGVVVVRLLGTAVARTAKRSRPRRPFLATLSSQDFALLYRANWRPVGIALAAAYAGIPARSLGDVVRGRLSGTERTAVSDALGFARELAMARAQRQIAQRGGQGIVGLRITERAAPGYRHVVELVVVGTIISLRPGGHRTLGVRTVLGLDDRVRAFAAEALRGEQGDS